MWYRGAVFACIVCTLPAEAGGVLICMKDGREVYGTVVQEKSGTILLKWSKGLIRLESRDVVNRIPETKIDSAIAIRSRVLKPDDAEGHVRLSLLCLEAGRWKEAKALLDKVQACLESRLAQEKAAEAAPAEKAEESGEPPWQPPAGASFKIEVKKKIQGETSDDPVRWSRIAHLFMDAGPSFSVLPYGSTGEADYVMRIGLEARVTGENKYFGSVPISRRWSGRVRLTINAGGTNKQVFRFDLPEVKDESSVNVEGGEFVLDKAFESFMRELQRNPIFRLRTRAGVSPPFQGGDGRGDSAR